MPPDFNNTMLSVWEELWNAMPQSGKIGVTVNSLLQQYKERCVSERKRCRDPSESPAALLPVSFVLAKEAQSEALQIGAVNEEAREMVADLSHSLSEQPPSTALLLNQPARLANPVIPQPVMSLGPEVVTDSVKANECLEERARRQAEEPSPRKTAPAPKKRKIIPPELKERQERAATRMKELGVLPLEVICCF